MPTASDLVTDLPADFEVFGQAVDTSLADLKGGTTDQVLAKNSNTDMDFKWVTSDDANAIQNSIVDAKGDLIAASANDTPARLAVGNNGETLVADSSTSTGLRYTANFAAGKNKIINGNFNINQRSFTSTTTSGTYGFDRWKAGFAGGTTTYSAQTFTAGNAPAAGYEGTNYARIVTTGQSAAGDLAYLAQFIEDVHTLAGNTFTISFWAKAATGTPKIGLELNQTVGTGGSGSSVTSVGNVTISTSWQRYSITGSLGTLVGVTPGTNNTSYLECILWVSAGSTWNGRAGGMQALQNNTFDIWGVQVEQGSVATAFQTATGTIQGELSAAQRYYQKSYDTTTAPAAATATGISAFVTATSVANNSVYASVPLRTTMRSTPTITCYSQNGTAAVASKVSDGLDLASNTAVASQIGANNFLVRNQNASTFTTTQGATFQWVAEAEL